MTTDTATVSGTAASTPRRSSIFSALIDFSVERRWIVLVLMAAAAAIGVWNYQRLPIDVVPDITNVQVQINAEAPG